MKSFSFVLYALVVICLFSCASQKPAANYLQTVRDTTGKEKIVIPELVIQRDDQLSIQVYSASTRADISDALYNLPATGGTAQSGAGPSAGGYLVDANGNIEYPRIGTLHVEGLTKSALAELIKRKINERDSVLTSPSVIVRFTNMKITVLGEVNNQGVINFPGERITVLQAIGLAGGVNEFGLKEKVKILREINGERQIGTIDLSSDNAFQSPFYNLVQNDVVIVDPSSQKAKNRSEEVNFRRASFFLGVVTSAAVLYNIFK